MDIVNLNEPEDSLYLEKFVDDDDFDHERREKRQVTDDDDDQGSGSYEPTTFLPTNPATITQTPSSLVQTTGANNSSIYPIVIGVFSAVAVLVSIGMCGLVFGLVRRNLSHKKLVHPKTSPSNGQVVNMTSNPGTTQQSPNSSRSIGLPNTMTRVEV